MLYGRTRFQVALTNEEHSCRDLPVIAFVVYHGTFQRMQNPFITKTQYDIDVVLLIPSA